MCKLRSLRDQLTQMVVEQRWNKQKRLSNLKLRKLLKKPQSVWPKLMPIKLLKKRNLNKSLKLINF